MNQSANAETVPCTNCHGDGKVGKVQDIVPGKPYPYEFDMCPQCKGTGRIPINSN
jgi:DnaJ-class molecular chaperone